MTLKLPPPPVPGRVGVVGQLSSPTAPPHRLACALLTSVLILLALAGCSPAGLSKADPGEPHKPAAPSRTVVVVARVEPNTLALKPLAGNFFGAGVIVAPFNASLELRD